MNVKIRPYRPADFDAVTILWRISRERSLPDLQRAKGYFFYQDLDFFRERVLGQNQVWVTVDETDRPTALMAMRDEFIDLLYVHPDHWRQGLGRQLLDHARSLSPQHLWLYTLQSNTQARAFYEKNGFVPERFGVSPPPESEPDVEYHWRHA
jgi:ribosomal protein S18 acetylase RimI-like enzyme